MKNHCSISVQRINRVRSCKNHNQNSVANLKTNKKPSCR